MQFSSLNEALQMGGHGAYVWAAYGLTLLVLGINVIAPILKRRALIKELKRSITREEVQNESGS
jgi:heme exporter protein D